MGIDAKMFLRTSASVTPEEVRRAAVDLCAVFGASKFYVYRPRAGEDGQHALEIVDQYTQDGPTLTPEPGETFVRASLATRFWGPGYERGDLSIVLAVAAWLEARFVGCVVWYGGDSSGVEAFPLDGKAREAMIAHAAGPSGAAYRKPRTDDRIRTMMGLTPDPPQYCAFCAGSQMTPCRWGGGSIGYICMGCSLHRLVSTSGTVTEDVGMYADDRAANGARIGAVSP